MMLSSNRDIQFLSFAHNLITCVPKNLFSNLLSLRTLDLSHNHIHDFDFNISGLYSLESLNLENNMISGIQEHISGLYSLENLKLKNNMISEIQETAREQLIQLAEHITPRVITVDLSNNQLACSCSNIPSLSFMRKTKPDNLMIKNYNDYLCLNRDNDRVHMHHVNLHSLWFDCLGSGVYVGIGFAYMHVPLWIHVPLW